MRRTRNLLSALALYATSMGAQATIADGTPLFKWVFTAPVAEFVFHCDGLLAAKKIIAAPALQWQSAASDWTVGSHSCAVTARDSAGVGRGTSNTVNFTIAAPIVPPVLTVE